jgi:hypothetical protein
MIVAIVGNPLPVILRLPWSGIANASRVCRILVARAPRRPAWRRRTGRRVRVSYYLFRDSHNSTRLLPPEISFEMKSTATGTKGIHQ